MPLIRRWIALFILLASDGGFVLRGETDSPKADPAGAAVVLEMSDVIGESKNTDAAFAQILARAASLAGEAKQRHESARIRINLEKNATYRTTRTIQLHHLSSLEIDGRGAKIVNTSIFQSTFEIQSSDHITISNLSIDYDPLPFTQGTVTAVDPSAQHLTIKVDAGYPDGARLLATLNGGICGVMDRATKALKPGARDFFSINRAQFLRQGMIRVELGWSANDLGPGQLPIAVGDVVALNASSAAAIVIENSAFVSYIGFNLYASPSIGIVENGGAGGMIFRRVHIVPGPKPAGATADRLFSTNRDGMHFTAAEHGPLIEDCTFANTGDDAINVHGLYLFVVKKLGARKYWLSPKWDIGLAAGDEIEGYDRVNIRSLGRTELTRLNKRDVPELKDEIASLWTNRSSTSLPHTIYEVELQHDLPLKPGDVIASLSRVGAGTIVRNCAFHACGRVMIKSPDSVIEDNRFSYSRGAAIFVGSDFGFWVESNFVRHLTILNNRFTHCNVGANNCFGNSDADGPGTIYLGISPPSDATGFLRNFENHTVVIAGNRIEDSYLYAIFATNADGLKIVDNVIGRTFIRGSAFSAGALYGLAPNSGIFLGMAKDAEIKNNTVARGAVAKVPLTIDRSCVRNTVVTSHNTLR